MNSDNLKNAAQALHAVADSLMKAAEDMKVLEDKCNYYLAQNVDGASYVEDVTGNIEMIYRKLARPLQELENERYRND